MSVYMVQYKSQKNNQVSQIVSQYGDCRVVGSSVLVATEVPIQQIRDQIQPMMSQSDHCSVIDAVHYSGWLPSAQWQWIRDQQNAK